LQAGADDFVTKPINAAVWRARIETQLRLRSARRQLQRQNDELGRMACNFERDLAAARLTQRSLIPPPPTPKGGRLLRVIALSSVGGDIYGWLRMKDRWMLFWIADGWSRCCRPVYHLAELLQHGSGARHTCQNHGSRNKDFVVFWRALFYDRDVCGRPGDRTSECGRRRSSATADCATRRDRALHRSWLALIERPKFTEKLSIRIGMLSSFIRTACLARRKANGCAQSTLAKMLDHSV
jgi:hypothetical protein